MLFSPPRQLHDSKELVLSVLHFAFGVIWVLFVLAYGLKPKIVLPESYFLFSGHSS